MTLDPRGDTAYVGYQDGSIDVSDLSGRRRLGRAFAWNTPQQSCEYAPCATVAPDSRLLATDQADGTIALVSLRTRARCGRCRHATGRLPMRSSSCPEAAR